MIWCYGVVAIGASDYRRASSWLPWCCVYFVSFSLGIGLVWLIWSIPLGLHLWGVRFTRACPEWLVVCFYRLLSLSVLSLVYFLIRVYTLVFPPFQISDSWLRASKHARIYLSIHCVQHHSPDTQTDIATRLGRYLLGCTHIYSLGCL